MSVDTTTKVLVVSARLISVMRDGCDQGDYDGRGQQSGKCHFVVKLRQGSGKERQGMALMAKGLKA